MVLFTGDGYGEEYRGVGVVGGDIKSIVITFDTITVDLDGGVVWRLVWD